MSVNIQTANGLKKIAGNYRYTVDGTLSKESENPIQNKAVATEIENINNAIDDLSGQFGTITDDEIAALFEDTSTEA